VVNNPLVRIDPDGETDIYIGGMGDRRSEIVSGYAQSPAAGASESRHVAYFGRNQKQEAIAYANSQIGNGEPMNIIGHSLGAAAAVEVARGVNGTVETS